MHADKWQDCLPLRLHRLRTPRLQEVEEDSPRLQNPFGKHWMSNCSNGKGGGNCMGREMPSCRVREKMRGKRRLKGVFSLGPQLKKHHDHKSRSLGGAQTGHDLPTTLAWSLGSRHDHGSQALKIHKRRPINRSGL